MRRVRQAGTALVLACHPQPTAAVTAVAAGLAVATGRSPGQVLGVAAAVLAGQLSVGWLNDLVDADRDAAVGRRGKPVAAGVLGRRPVGIAVALAAVAAVALSLLSGLPAAVAHTLALVSAWAYDLGVKATAWSALPYALSFGLLPAFVVLGLPGAPVPPAWLVVAAATLGCAAHVANALPDLRDDLATGVRGLPHRLGAVRGRYVASALVLTATITLLVGPPGAVSAAGAATLAVVVAITGTGLLLGRRTGSRAAFTAILLVALVDVGLLVFTAHAIG